jgi:hypothetical protein
LLLHQLKREIIAAGSTIKEVIWIRNLLSELNEPQHDPTEIHIDNQPAIDIILKDMAKTKTKHIALQHQFIKDYISKMKVRPVYIPTKQQPADLLTKPLGKQFLEYHRNNIMGNQN